MNRQRIKTIATLMASVRNCGFDVMFISNLAKITIEKDAQTIIREQKKVDREYTAKFRGFHDRQVKVKRFRK